MLSFKLLVTVSFGFKLETVATRTTGQCLSWFQLLLIQLVKVPVGIQLEPVDSSTTGQSSSWIPTGSSHSQYNWKLFQLDPNWNQLLPSCFPTGTSWCVTGTSWFPAGTSSSQLIPVGSQLEIFTWAVLVLLVRSRFLSVAGVDDSCRSFSWVLFFCPLPILRVPGMLYRNLRLLRMAMGLLCLGLYRQCQQRRVQPCPRVRTVRTGRGTLGFNGA